ncbi:MAG: hypothetical protein JRI56_07290, partial [Deltaproteobacteria bacterium]|nr:hypothetical protein [Deltaproteobacteria bacterium]
MDVWVPGHGRLKIYSDLQGYPLDSWERASRLLAAVRHEIDLGKFDPKAFLRQGHRALAFQRYVEEWLVRRRQEYERGHISGSYFTETKDYVHRYYIPFFGRMNLRNLREGHIEDFRNWLPRHLSAKTVHNILGILHKLLRDAYRRRDILVLPEFPKVEKGEPMTKWITEE